MECVFFLRSWYSKKRRVPRLSMMAPPPPTDESRAVVDEEAARSDDLHTTLRQLDAQLAPLMTFEHLVALRSDTARMREGLTYGEIVLGDMRHILEYVGLRAGQRFLDVGCGTGRWLAVARLGFGAEAFGVECLAERAQIAQRHFGQDRVTCDSGANQAVWDWASPHVVVMFDLVFTQFDLIEECARRTPSVEWVIRSSDRPLDGFSLEKTFPRVTQYHPDVPESRQGAEYRCKFHAWRRQEGTRQI